MASRCWSRRPRPPTPRRLHGRGRRVGIVFGPERTGLTNDELLLADALVSYPGQPRLRLAQRGPGRAAVRLWLVPAGRRRTAPGCPVRPACQPPRPRSAVWSTIWCTSSTRSDFFRAEERRASLIRTITVMLERRQWTASEVAADARHHQGSGGRPAGAGEARRRRRLRRASERYAMRALAGHRRRAAGNLNYRLYTSAGYDPCAGNGGRGLRGTDGAGPAGQGRPVPVADVRSGGDHPDRERGRPMPAGSRSRWSWPGTARPCSVPARASRLSLPDRARAAMPCSSTCRP